MSDPVASGLDPAQPFAPSRSWAEAGAALRQAREAAGLHIAALAVSLKVPVRKIEALEAGDLTQLPDAVFARALAAAVCRNIKIDPESVLRLLPQLETPPLQVGAAIGPTRFDARGRSGGAALFASLSRPVVYGTAALLVGAFLLLILPILQRGGSELVVVPVERALERDLGQPQPAALVPSVGVVPDQVASAPSIAASATAPEPVAGATAALAVANDKVGAAERGAIAVFTTKGPSWVQVTDADGVVHLSRTMAANETANVAGAMPLSVIVGRVNEMALVVRGKPFDLAAVAKDNVARFQIK